MVNQNLVWFSLLETIWIFYVSSVCASGDVSGDKVMCFNFLRAWEQTGPARAPRINQSYEKVDKLQSLILMIFAFMKNLWSAL
jgi:hypothetical protein